MTLTPTKKNAWNWSNLKDYTQMLWISSLSNHRKIDLRRIKFSPFRFLQPAVCYSRLGNDVCRIYGDYLLTKKYYEDAALMYDRGGLPLQAVNAWEKSLNWKYCIALAQATKLPNVEFHKLCSRLVESLKECKRYGEAAQILESHMKDSEEAIATMIEGRLWADAARLIWSYQRPDLRGMGATTCVNFSKSFAHVSGSFASLSSRNAFLTETFGPLLLHPLILTIQARIIQAANRSTQNCLGDEAETGRWSIWRGGHQHGGRGSLLWHHEHDRDHGHVWHLWQKVQSGILENKVKVFSIVYTAVTIYIFFYISCSFNPGTRRDQRTAKTGGSRSGRSILPKRAALMKILASLPACTTSFPWLTTTQVSAINNSLSLHCPQTNSFPVFQPRSENWREPLSNLTNLLWPRNSRQRWFPSWMRPRVPFPKSGWPPILMPKEMDLRAAMKHLEVPETSSALRHQLLISLVEVKRPPFTDRLSKFWVSQRS